MKLPAAKLLAFTSQCQPQELESQISVKLPRHLYDAIKTQASVERRSITAVLSIILEAYYRAEEQP